MCKLEVTRSTKISMLISRMTKRILETFVLLGIGEEAKAFNSSVPGQVLVWTTNTVYLLCMATVCMQHSGSAY
ncbi:hypothetical protein GLYMA_08G102800v4 [Glycine max]|uniref:Uncharacterized protein n=1 Tax=Glycine max TaxID=3847 RepID=K7L5V7_SOYBN|nr:hypothetical protein GYH30_020823 [Glycine max]KRH42644.1 hypothetical protein GLYMA_08G102800v4 [Glycine max]